jgi:N6-adenosine-specific RNA methylase IME4
LSSLAAAAAASHSPCAALTTTHLATLPIGCDVVSNGLMFFEVQRKELIGEVVALMEMWGFRYVESCTWIWQQPNNQFACEAAPLLQRSHSTVLVGRKGGGALELRHQRRCDVMLAPRRTRGEVPPALRELVEVLLPDPHRAAAKGGAAVPAEAKARFLELVWPTQDATSRIRAHDSWITIAQKPGSHVHEVEEDEEEVILIDA